MCSVAEAPAVGASAPDAEALLSDGNPARLSGLWRDGPVALVFLRHFG